MYHGSGFNVPSSTLGHGLDQIIGFYTTRVLVATSEVEARERAVPELLKEETLKHLISVTTSTTGREPIIEIESIKKLSWFEDRQQKHAGFSFYAND